MKRGGFSGALLALPGHREPLLFMIVPVPPTWLFPVTSPRRYLPTWLTPPLFVPTAVLLSSITPALVVSIPRLPFCFHACILHAIPQKADNFFPSSRQSRSMLY